MALAGCESASEVEEATGALTEESQTTQPNQYGVYASIRLDIASRASITAPLTGARGVVWVDPDARIDGTVVSGTEINLRDRTRVTRDARSSGRINLGSNVSVAGLTVPNVAVPLPPAIPSHPVTVGRANYTVYAGASRSLNSGSYGDVVVNANGTLILNGTAAGSVFSFRNLILQSDAKLVLNTAGGDLSIDVLTGFSCGDRARTTLNGTSDGLKIHWYFNGTSDARIGTDVNPFYGIITAPSARVELADRSRLTGAVRGKSVRIGVGAVVSGIQAGCPAGHRAAGDLAGVCVNYLEETSAGDLLSPFVSDVGLDRFYQTHADEYDAVAFIPATYIPAHTCSHRSNSVQGINRPILTMPTYPNLQSVLHVGMHDFYQAGFHGPLIAVHELAHNWGVFLLGLYADPSKEPPAHWPYHTDLFEGASGYLDPLAYYNWVLEGGSETCTSQSDSFEWKFSKLTLYLMGLLPPEEVGVVKVHDFEPKPGDDVYNAWGPTCDQDHVFTGTRTVIMADFIALNGPRVPSFATSPKNFKIALVVVWPYGEPADPGFLRYVHEEKQLLSDMWFTTTGGRSRLTID
jgi:hypothetical protein